MKSFLVLCVLLGAVVSVRTASVSLAETTETDFLTTTLPTTTLPPTFPETTTTACDTSTTPTTPYPTTPSYPTQSQIMCPEGWEVFMGRCYYFMSENLNWPQAQSNCAMLESMLVSVHSAQEYGFLQQFANNNEYEVSWLGGFYLQDQWLWLDGSWFYNITWGNQSPGNSNPCLVLNSYEEWSNSPCINYEYPSICVKDSNVPSAILCPQGWTGFHGRCYYHNYELLSWHDADAYCASLDAALVSVHSPEEYSFLYRQTNDNGVYATWLGGFYLEDQWAWLDGSWFFQGFFSESSPDSTYPCLATQNADGWSNYDCDQTFRSFCVKNPVV